MVSCVDPEVSCEDLYGLYIEPTQEAYIYAFQQDATGDIFELFPNAEYSSHSNPIPAGTRFWVPNDFEGWLYLDENIGQETIFVVAGPKRIDVLEELAEGVTSSGPGNSGAKTQLVALINTLRGPGGVVKRNVPLSLPDGRPKDLETLVLNSAGEQEFVYRLTFQHVAPVVLQ